MKKIQLISCLFILSATVLSIKTLAQKAIPDVLRALNCGDSIVEGEAAKTLGEIASGEPQVVAALVNKIKQDDKKGSAWFAASSLGQMGADSEQVISTLKEASGSKCEGMSLCANSTSKPPYMMPRPSSDSYPSRSM